ncbi:MAG: glycosyltransferase family 2 protein [Stellaceae bacterium]
MSSADAPRLAVLIPCYNEEASIAKVVADFRACLPAATIYVYDNNSRDGTAAAARGAGALVRREDLQGKGHVVRRMFADIEADAYVLVDGDDTYDAMTAPEMVRVLIDNGLDMVTGARVTEIEAAYRRGHRLGNRLLTGMVGIIFGNRITDMLSGYRVLSRRFVKSFPALALGFEIETEFSVHALDLHMPVAEIETFYRDRPAGSHSKLRTIPDGLRILRTIVVLVKDERPLQFFSLAGLLLFLAGFGCGIPVVVDFLKTGLVPRLPTAVLATGLILLSSLSFAVGLILDTVARGRKEAKRLVYLAIPGTASQSWRGGMAEREPDAVPAETLSAPPAQQAGGALIHPMRQRP